MTDRALAADNICNCLALRQAARAITAAYDQALGEVGLRITQFSILYRLSAKGPMTVNQIARELVLDRTTLTRNLKPLERDLLVVSGASEYDRRERVIKLSDAGRDKVKAGIPLWRRAQQEFEQRFGQARAQALRDELHAVVVLDGGVPPVEADAD